MATISKRKLEMLSVASHLSGKLSNTFEVISNYIFAGNAVFTLVNEKTGVRYTYLVTRAKAKTKDEPVENLPFFVSVLMGTDNQQRFMFVGTIFNKKDYKNGNVKVGLGAPFVKGILYMINKLSKKESLDDCMQVYHLGRCGRCGRPLTEPESVATGLGPICGGDDRIKLTVGQKRKLKIKRLED